jgi:hypothetical protein
MSVATISEQLFEAHCSSRGAHFRRLPETTSRQPDYELLLCPGSIIAEVKQIDPNKTDLSPEVLRQCQERGYGLAPVDRVRGLIASGYTQLKPYAKRGYPCILVAYNNAGLVNYIDEHTVTKAMFGPLFLQFQLAPSGALRWAGTTFGGGRKVTRNSCRSLSALCVLETGSPGTSRLHVYHNPYADVPANTSQLSGVADFQYVYDDPHQNRSLFGPRLLEV